MQKGTSNDSGTAETTPEDMMVLGKTRRGNDIVAEKRTASVTTADTNTPDHDSRTNFGADATRKVEDAARTPRGVANETLEIENPDVVDGPTVVITDPRTGETEQMLGTATADVERIAGEQAELARLSRLADVETRDPQAVRDMQARRARESRKALRETYRRRTESTSIPWWDLSDTHQERFTERYGRSTAMSMCEESRKMSPRAWIEAVPVSAIPKSVWSYLDDVYQEEAGFSVNKAVETESVVSPSALDEPGASTGDAVAEEREVLTRVPKWVLREAWTRYYLAQHGDQARKMMETRLDVLSERIGYEVEPHAPERRVAASIAERLEKGQGPMSAGIGGVDEWLTNGVNPIQAIEGDWPAATTRGIVTRRFEDTHPNIRAAFTVADPTSGDEAKVTIWETTAVAEGSTRFPGQSAFEADGNGDKHNVIDIPVEGQWVLLENCKPGWYSGQLTLAVTTDSVVTPLHHADEYDSSDTEPDTPASAPGERDQSSTPDAVPPSVTQSERSPTTSSNDVDVEPVVAPTSEMPVTAAAAEADGSRDESADDDGSDEMDAFVTAVYHYAQSLRKRVSTYKEMHQMVEQTPPPSREDVEDVGLESASPDDDGSVDTTVARSVAAKTVGVVPEDASAGDKSTNDGEADNAVVEQARYGWDREPPETPEE